ncbi:MAG: HAMP domain-containing sensor histidine kinase [Inconstantimicrobium porci]|uniref:HAMP domain-containing sensor histidine kinase n=1 Tax=Inconstantimicrobium porci TaxID=2652291 RepID=UPI002A913517|nr:HAMP domain-containing sensor histidine kinase [Inconstantimicrobium porci]MDY5912796.1 HAMP domain-containing sensor histidine kinase [Inconstantimicrobium porci]
MKKIKKIKKKKLVNLLLKNYIISFLLMLTLLIATTFTVFTIANIYYNLIIENDVTASVFFRDDYKQIPYKVITSKHGFAYVYDTNGKILVDKHYTVNFDYQKFNPENIFSIVYKDGFNNKANPNLTLSYEHYKIKAGYNKKQNYILIIGYPKKGADFFTTIDRKLNFKVFSVLALIICILLFFVIFSIYSRFTSRFFVTPVNILIEGAEKFAAGDYSSRITLKVQNEFKDLGDTLNLMASRISEEKHLKEKSEFARKRLILDVSHDLKNPLSNIMGYADYLVSNDISKEEMSKYLYIIQQNSIRANNLIQNLFEFSKLDSEDFHLQLEETDICEFMRELIASYIPALDQKHFNYDFDIPEEKILLNIDKKQLDRAISNLILNAIKYNKEGTALSITIQFENNTLSLIICDNGVGIPESSLSTIFDPFVRVDKSRNIHSGGTGLGLSITKTIIEKHNGSIDLISAVNKGCKFIISFTLNHNI